MAAPGLIIAAPASGQGKTVTTLAIIRALARAGVKVAAAKAGPDYIDPAFHAAAGGKTSGRCGTKRWAGWWRVWGRTTIS
jgi:cobyrinic acid a,c-diamide synthase